MLLANGVTPLSRKNLLKSSADAAEKISRKYLPAFLAPPSYGAYYASARGLREEVERQYFRLEDLPRLTDEEMENALGKFLVRTLIRNSEYVFLQNRVSQIFFMNFAFSNIQIVISRTIMPNFIFRNIQTFQKQEENFVHPARDAWLAHRHVTSDYESSGAGGPWCSAQLACLYARQFRGHGKIVQWIAGGLGSMLVRFCHSLQAIFFLFSFFCHFGT